ncbi:MAG TPA: M56 family metallopeptidase [Thermoanaerobaculia bacterium]|nr:M56 family metallopeptidase [Thermoanaerobaculia bacterium]
MTVFLSGVLVHSLWQALVAAALVAGFRALGTRAEWRYPVACIAFFAVPVAAVASRWKPAPIALDGVVDSWHRWIVAGWSVGVCAQAIPLFFAVRQLVRLRRNGERAEDELMQRFEVLREAMRVRFHVELRVISEKLAPMAFGLVRPVIVFPLALLLRLPQDEVDAVLLHELAHLRRRDPWINAAQIVVESLFFFNPALLWISKRIRAERELCCDALVLTSGGGRIEYARALAGMARFFAPAVATGATGGDLVVRMEHLAGISPRRSWAGALAFFLGAAIVFASTGAGQDWIARLGDERWYVRAAAVDRLSKMDTPESTAALVRALEDGNWSIRQQAIDALVARGDPSVIPALRRRSREDPNWAVRAAAANAVSTLR